MSVSLPDTAIPRSAELTQATPAPRSRGLLSGGLALLLLAAVAYRPWMPAPLSILDFSEFVPILQQSGSFFDGLMALVRYYAGHGRSAVLTYAWIAANFHAFGTASAGWELTRFTLMLVNSVVALALLRRIGVSPFAAFLGAALLVTATGATAAWLRLNGEMISMLALLTGAHLALSYPGTRRWRRAGVLFALAMAAAVLAKETCIVLVPLLLVPALRYPAGARDSRQGWLLAMTAAALLPCVLLVLDTARSADAGGYIQSYGAGGWTPGRAIGAALRFGFPLFSGDLRLNLLAGLPYLLVLVAGWRAASRQLRFPRAAARASYLLLFVLAGMVIYMPWPRIEPFYTYPFLAGPVLLFALALHHVRQERSRTARVMSVLGVVLVLLCTIAAHNTARLNAALQRLNADVVRLLPRLPVADTLVVAVRGLAPQPWQGTGPTLRRFALATGAAEPLPPAIELLCEEAHGRRSRGTWAATLLSYHHSCGPLRGADVSVAAPFAQLDLAAFRIRRDALRADLLLGTAPSAPGPRP